VKSSHWVFALFLLLFSAVQCFAVQNMAVQVRNGQLRESPSFLGKLIVEVSYGDKVTLVKQQGDWMRVTTSHGVTGWIHGSALTTKRIAMSAGSQDATVAASGDELALAGKGFNKDVEADFKSKNKNIDYTWVDAMGSMTVTPNEIAKFVDNGDLHPMQ
jgi:uncharacterized protein YgiM (DUF1202 family)